MKAVCEKINVLFAQFTEDTTKQMEKSNKAAGSRARKTSLDLEKLLKEFRKASIEEAKK